MTTPTLTDRLIDHIAAIRFDQLPAPVIDIARHVTLDTVGVILAGATEPLGVGRLIKRYVRDAGGTPQASVFTGAFKTSLANAAFANGTMAHALDFDNTWYPLTHPSSPTIPAILAAAEARAANGRQVIEAVVAAFEVEARVRLAATGWNAGRGFHKNGIVGALGAVAGVGKLIGLDAEGMRMALGITGSRCGALAINTGSMTKSSHSGHAARMGVECALLAEMGWTGSADIFGKGGLLDTFVGADCDPEALVRNFGAPFYMLDPGVGFKRFPCNYFTHRPIQGVLELRQRHGVRAADLAELQIRFPDFDYVDRPVPKTGLDGKFSVQYTALLALLDGCITIDSFSEERRHAADIAQMLPKMRLILDPAIPNDFMTMHCALTAQMKSGASHTVRVEKLSGWVGSPLTTAERHEKFRDCALRTLDADAVQRLIDTFENLETQTDLNATMDLLRNAKADA